MFPTPRPNLQPDTPEFESLPLIAPSGFREYDVRWRFPGQINRMGVQAMGLSLGTLLRDRGVESIITGHDFRSYSGAIKQALTVGLMDAGMAVHDIGLALSPTAYFAQFKLDIPAVAMVTASHNENGWTGIKIGADKPRTFGPDDIQQLKEIALGGKGRSRAGGGYRFEPAVAGDYVTDLTSRPPFSRRLKLVIACGNGTAGVFAPQVFAGLGAEVVELDCNLDPTFPRCNPDPENMEMLKAVRTAVLDSNADMGLAFDGDGDRCGVVDDRGREIFADKIGVLLARDISSRHKAARFIADVKSTALFDTDPVLRANGAQTEYWQPGHSHIKRRLAESGAQAAFERSGHYVFAPPDGRGYDDGLLSGIAICEMLCRGDTPLSELYETLPPTHASPGWWPDCPDEDKYAVVAAVTDLYRTARDSGESVAGEKIRDLVTASGVRVVLEDGTWGLIRASSNKPVLVVVAESPVSGEQTDAMIRDIKARLESVSG